MVVGKDLQTPTLNGEISETILEENAVEDSMNMDSNTKQNGILTDSSPDGDEIQTSDKIKFIVSEEDDEFTDAIENSSYGLSQSKDFLDINKGGKHPIHMRLLCDFSAKN